MKLHKARPLLFPGQTISSYVDLIKESLNDNQNPQIVKWFKYVLDGTATMKALIDGLLAYSKLNGNEQLMAPVNLNLVLSRIIRSVKALDSSAVIKCEDLPSVQGFEIQILQLFQNIIVNAVKYKKRDQQACVKISWSQFSDQFYGFSVEDNGIGFDPEHSDRIFQLFQRLHTRDEYDGTGLGLAICRKIVELHGGKIWAQSSAGLGSKFMFTLPRSLIQENAS